MNKRVLAVTENPELLTFCKKTGDDLVFDFAPTGEDGLATLNETAEWDIILADYNLSDMDGIQFFTEAEKVSRAIRVLAADADEIIARIAMVNNKYIYRILPLPCSQGMLNTVLHDAFRQFCLVTRERQLLEKIKQLSTTDTLTGCFTRTYSNERLAKELQRSVRYCHYLTVIFADIDEFQRINDTHGHRTGDQILTGFSQAALQIIREDVDWISRWDDNKFLIVLPETPIRGAGIVAERLRELISGIDITSDNNGPVDVTASFGVAGFAPEIQERNNNPDALLTIADRCLVQAITAGGDQVLCCP
ncbi:MAG: diguanylate cyclase [Desulfobulbaceae bacterium]|nr:diguanylate cyclase [Desulfobulbaceae bacterium]